MSNISLGQMDWAQVLQALHDVANGRAVFSVGSNKRRSLSLAQVADELGFSVNYVRRHLGEFPNAWRAPGGGVNGGELRIPVADLDAFMQRRRIRQA